MNIVEERSYGGFMARVRIFSSVMFIDMQWTGSGNGGGPSSGISPYDAQSSLTAATKNMASRTCSNISWPSLASLISTFRIYSVKYSGLFSALCEGLDGGEKRESERPSYNVICILTRFSGLV